MRKSTQHLSLLVLLAIAALLPAGCRPKETLPAGPAQLPPVRALVTKVAAQPFSITVPITGTLVSTSRVDIKAEITGRLVRFDKKEGDRVSAGEVVAWVDEENYRLAVAQAQSAVNVAEAALEKTRVAEAYSRSELERAENLVKSGGITDKDLKAARVAEQDARAQTALAAAQLAQAKAALNAAEKRLRDCRIVAPVAGEIQQKYVNPGAYVEPPTPVLSIVNNQNLELESSVAAAELAPIRAGQRVTFTVNSYPAESFSGQVVDINPAVDAETRSAKVRVRVDNRGGRLKAGMFAQGEILTGVDSQAIVIPAGAVYREDRSAKTSSVFVLEDGVARRRGVRIGRERDGQLEIVEGLKPGDLLVVEQSIELAEGVRVTPRS